jgi:uncharacterized protein (TIGR03067 family)
MKRFVFGFALMALVVGLAAADDKSEKGGAVKNDKNAAEAKKLEGTWEIVAFENKGEKKEARKGGSIVFAKDMKITMKDPKGEKKGKYKIDVSKDPKTLDLIELKDGKEGEVMQMIYAVEGDAMKWGFSAEGPKGKRPTSFDGENVGVMHLKRQKS